jgi:hypothetical protein
VVLEKIESHLAAVLLCREFGPHQEYFLTVADFIQLTIESRYNTNMTTIAKDVEKKEWTLNANDRCDRCGSQAYVKIGGSTGELLFCAHHYNKIVDNPDAYTKMMAFMLVVVDERERLVENRLIGSAN